MVQIVVDEDYSGVTVEDYKFYSLYLTSIHVKLFIIIQYNINTDTVWQINNINRYPFLFYG